MKPAFAIIGTFALIVWFGVFISTPNARAGGSFVVSQGESAESIIRRLKDEGVIRSRLLFTLALKRSGLATRLQPGTYDLRGAASYRELAENLASGGIAEEESVLLVIEGWDLRDIRTELARIEHPAAGNFFAVAGEPPSPARPSGRAAAPDAASGLALLADKPATLSLEGYLFPDTYRIFKDATAEEIVHGMLVNLEQRLTPELRAAIAASGRSTFEIITLASIIEREVRGDRDRRLVSDLFWRRLAIGMALQADSTVNYVTGGGRASVTFKDIEVDSRYNTYKYRGLPLGPICNPGLSAIEAAVAPEPNDFWFFLTDPEGNVHYANTLEEHNRNRAKYLR